MKIEAQRVPCVKEVEEWGELGAALVDCVQHGLARQVVEAVLEVDAEVSVEFVPERNEEVRHTLDAPLSAEPQLDELHLFRRVLRRLVTQRTLEGPLEQRRADVDRSELGLEPARGPVRLLLGTLLVQREQPSAGEQFFGRKILYINKN